MVTKTAHDSEASAHGYQVITACVFTHKNFGGVERLFLPKRASTHKFLPDVYELPGGHIEYGEDIVVGLKREIMEEFRMEISVGDSFYVFTYDNDIKGSHSIEVIYFATFINPISEITLDPEDHSSFVWVDKGELVTLLKGTPKEESDPEYKAMLKAFSLLNGEGLNFG